MKYDKKKKAFVTENKCGDFTKIYILFVCMPD